MSNDVSTGGRRPTFRRAFGVLLGLILLLAFAGSAPALTAGNLPGGTSISVDITAPSDGAIKVFPPGNIELEGTAAVGAGVPVPNTGFVYVVDGSGSSAAPAGGDCGPEQNPGDPETVEDEIIDCEIAAVITLNDAVTALGTVGQVGMTIFAGASATADATPPVSGDDPLIAPGADANTNGTPDVDEVLHSIRVAEFGGEQGGYFEFATKLIPDLGGTDFADAAGAACTLATSLSTPIKQVIFLSDGVANVGADVTTVLPCGAVVFQTFAVGSLSSCAGDPSGLGSLQEIANLTGGSCFEIEDPSDLPASIVPAVIQSRLVSLELSVDGLPFVDISGSSSVPLPAPGPVNVTYEHLVPGLAPGIHELCVRANGTDGGGAGSVTDCIEVTVATIDAGPDAINELGTPGQTHTVTATVEAGADGGVAGVTVDFLILSGPNAGASGSDVTDVNGEASFTYVATQGPAGLGTDVIRACFTDEQDDTVCDTAEKLWEDTTPPVAACRPTTNPSGNNVPGGSNEDGFFILLAIDAVDPDPEIFIHDSASSFVAGPFPSGTTIKLIQSPGGTPSVTAGPGVIDWRVRLNGDALLVAVDDSGNESDPIACLVPPPPK